MKAVMEVFTLGGLKILRQHQPADLGSRKAEALILYLAVNHRPQSREVLADLLWDDRSQRRALSNLRVVLSNLRKQFDPYFAINRDAVALNPEAGFWLDAAEFEQSLIPIQKSGRFTTSSEAALVERAMQLYRGEFLQGFYVRESRGFDEWMVRERERLHRLAVGALHALVEYDLQAGSYPSGIARATRLLELDPLMEAAHRQMMQLLAGSGRRGEALAQYETCRQLLREELGIEPSRATRDLYERIRSGTILGPSKATSVLRGYRLYEQIGSGSFGAVYRAFQPEVGREVAIKVILPQYANQPDFIRRFETEAQIVARLEHPHIVPLYDYWREPDGAYLVMRWLRGGSLGQLLEDGPLAVERALGMLDQVTEALYAAHQQGIVHRDLKPANILLDESGNAYLSGFGVARQLGGNIKHTLTGALIGSPAYMAPEQFLDEPATPRSDIYSLGLLIYQMLSGEAPYPVDSLAVLIEKHLHEPLPSLASLRPDLPVPVNDVLQQATAKDPKRRYPDPLMLVTALRSAFSGRQVPAPDRALLAAPVDIELHNPYKGLRAFQEADAGDFYGREALVERLLARLSVLQKASSSDGHAPGEGRFLAVVGPSGSGKSSLVKAGLIPALRAGRLPGAENWFIVEMLPGTHPLEELESALLRVAVNPPESLLSQIKEDTRGLVRSVKRLLPGRADAELLLIIDQFEEIFTLVEDRGEARFFLDILVAAVSDPRGQVQVVITLRADFYDRPLMITGFSQLVQAGTEVVLPLTAEELVAAIREPASRAGARFEDGLVPRIVADVNEQPGALPLLQYSLTELFERREGDLLTKAGYAQIGGVLGALSRRAEEVYQGLDERRQAESRQVFLRLVTLGEGVEDTRRRVLRAELEALEGLPHSALPYLGQERGNAGKQSVGTVLDAFGKARLLSFDRDPGTRGPTVEVAHEALLREWSRLHAWLQESREDLRLQRLLGQMAADWRTSGEDSSFLLRGSRLELIESWTQETEIALTTAELDYLQASLAKREARRAEEASRQAREAALERRSRDFLRGLVAVFAMAAVVAVFLSLFAFGQQRLARRNEAVAGQNAATAVAARGEAEELASLRSREAQVNQSLALAAQSQLASEAGNLDLALALAMQAASIPDPPGQAQMALSEVAYAPGTIRVFLGHNAPVWSVAVSPDGHYGLSGDADGVIFLWDLETGEALRRLEGHEGLVSSLAFTPDGRRALSGSHDKTILYWDLQTGDALWQITGHQAMVNTVAVSPDGRLAASGSGRDLITDEHPEALDNSIRLWDLRSGEQLMRFDFFSDGVTGVAFAADGQQLAIATVSEGFWLLELETGKVLGRKHQAYLFHDDALTSVAVSRDGRIAATAEGTENQVMVWDLRSGESLGPLKGHNSTLLNVAVSPDGRRVLAGSITVIEWDAHSGEQVQQFNYGANTVAFLPDGARALIGSQDHSLRLLALGSGAEIGRYSGTDWVRGVAYSPSGQTALMGFGELRLWDLETGAEVWTQITESGASHKIAFSPDGQQALVSEFGQATLYQASTGEVLRRLESDGSFVGHPDDEFLYEVAFHPSGKYALTSSTGAPATPLIYWDLETGRPVWLFSTTANVLGVAISPDGTTALSAEGDNSVNWWDLETGQIIAKLAGHNNIVWDVEYLDDCTAISASEDSTLILWDLERGTALRTFLGHASGVKRVVLSPDRRQALSASRDGTAILWDLESGAPLRRYSGHSQELMDVAFHPNGKEALTGGRDNLAIRWRIDPDLESLLDWIVQNRYVRALTCSERQAFQVEPCAGGTAAQETSTAVAPITGSRAALLPPLPAPTPRPAAPERQPLPSEFAGRAVRGSNPGSIPMGGGQIWEYLGETGERLSIRVAAEDPANTSWSIDRQVETGLLDPTLAVYAPDGSLLAGIDDLENGVSTDAYLAAIELPQAGTYRIEVRSYRDRTGGDYRLLLGEPRPLVFRAGLRTAGGLAITRDGKLALVGAGQNTVFTGEVAPDNRVWVWDLASGEPLRWLVGHQSTPAVLAISPDGRKLLSGSVDGLVILWDLSSGEEIRRFKIAAWEITAIRFRPDGRTALVGTADPSLLHLDLVSGEVIRRFEGHTSWLLDLALSPDGTTAYSSSRDGTLRLWDVESGRSLAVYQPFAGDLTNGLGLSPDGSRLLVGAGDVIAPAQATGSAAIALLEASTGERLLELEGHTAVVQSVAFSPDGRYALSGSRDTTVRLWDLATGEQLAVFTGHTHEVWKVAFSPDGLTGYSTSRDGSLRVWDLSDHLGSGEGAFIQD